MKLLRDLPLAQKLIWLMTATSTLGLLIAGTVSGFYGHLSRPQSLVCYLSFAVASLAAAFLVALWLRHFISRPILDLVRVAKTVSREKNFSLRATPYAKDDLGRLVESFNEMLEEIEKRDSALKSEVTDRLYAEKALRVSHNESELFINAVPSILIGTDAEGQITRWNRTAANTFGLSEAAVRGRTLKNCGISWLNSRIDDEIDSWLRVERSERRDNLMFQRNGDRHFLGITISRVEFLSQGGVGFLITGTDVTERKQLEEQLRQAQKLEAIGQLAAGIAHEINTPAQYVGDNTQFLKESWPVMSELLGLCQGVTAESKAGAVNGETLARLAACTEQADLAYLLEEIPRAIDQSLEGVQRVAKIVKAIKEFSHPGSEEKRAIDVNRAIETTITVARNEWKYVADVVTHFDTTLPPVPCLAGEFNQVILNLLINAAQAIGEAVGDGAKGKGVITITTRREGEQIEIRIQDTGKGVPEAIRGRIFEPFFTTKPVGKGTGQGLAIAHSVIVKKHDGQIWFDSEIGKGTTFFVRLPLVAAGQS